MGNAATADLTALVKSFEQAKRMAPGESQKLLEKVGDRVETLMKQYAPYRTGRLYMAIRKISEPGRVTIGNTDPSLKYDVYQEYGTGTKGEFPGAMYTIRPVRAERLVFKINGKWISTKEVKHPGVKPHPFARPAAKDALDDVEAQWAQLGVELIMGGRQ